MTSLCVSGIQGESQFISECSLADLRHNDGPAGGGAFDPLQCEQSAGECRPERAGEVMASFAPIDVPWDKEILLFQYVIIDPKVSQPTCAFFRNDVAILQGQQNFSLLVVIGFGMAFTMSAMTAAESLPPRPSVRGLPPRCLMQVGRLVGYWVWHYWVRWSASTVRFFPACIQPWQLQVVSSCWVACWFSSLCGVIHTRKASRARKRRQNQPRLKLDQQE